MPRHSARRLPSGYLVPPPRRSRSALAYPPTHDWNGLVQGGRPRR